ncbi:MAG: lipoprotein releasing system, ATP-binding protein [Legionellales bacterium RIFCSPHIGHO2_12_FULL_35_11]|nr:MAG: lipoprotein releasing system, ATP-binding protein [Legionellales bacterium RIFCSPHIGHO2_12_FULL_35_11]
MNNIIIESINLSKFYNDGAGIVNVLDNVQFALSAGDKIAIIGSSGSGKSTLLHLLGGLDKPSSGDVLINGQSFQSLKENERCVLRNQQLGFVYQFHHLLPEFSALENVAMPLLMKKLPIHDVTQKSQEMLIKVGLKDRMHHKVAQLSGGERARVAIARALVHKPACVLADEPTGNLDESTAMMILDLMLEINAEVKTALIIVTHDKKIASKMSKILTLKDKKLHF